MQLEEILATARPPAALSVAPASGRWSCGFGFTMVFPWRLFLALEERRTEHAIQLEEIFCHGKATGSTIRSTSEWTLWLRFRVVVVAAMEIVSCAWDGSSSVKTCCRTEHAAIPLEESSPRQGHRQRYP